MVEEKRATAKKLTFRQRLAKAQYEISKTELKKEGHNPFYNSTYSTLDNYNNAVQPALEKNAIYQTFKFCSMEGTGTILKLIVADAHSDEMMESCLRLPEYKKDIHSFGSEITYSKRLLLSAFFNLSTSENDDDGNSAMNTPHKNPAKKTNSVPSSENRTPTSSRGEEGTPPKKEFWFSVIDKDTKESKPDERKWATDMQTDCESRGISYSQLWDYIFESKFLIGRGEKRKPITHPNDIQFISTSDKETIRSAIARNFTPMEMGEEEAELVEVNQGVDEDDIPF